MPKPTIKSLEAQIATLHELREGDRRQYDNLNFQLCDTKQRLKEIAADNESLRMDKKWLQSIHSNLLQSMRFSGPKVI